MARIATRTQEPIVDTVRREEIAQAVMDTLGANDCDAEAVAEVVAAMVERWLGSAYRAGVASGETTKAAQVDRVRTSVREWTTVPSLINRDRFSVRIGTDTTTAGQWPTEALANQVRDRLNAAGVTLHPGPLHAASPTGNRIISETIAAARASIPIRWASVAQDANWATAQNRHLVRQYGDTSVCGTTALPASIWRGNTIKPICPACVSLAAERGIPLPEPNA